MLGLPGCLLCELTTLFLPGVEAEACSFPVCVCVCGREVPLVAGTLGWCGVTPCSVWACLGTAGGCGEAALLWGPAGEAVRREISGRGGNQGGGSNAASPPPSSRPPPRRRCRDAGGGEMGREGWVCVGGGGGGGRGVKMRWPHRSLCLSDDTDKNALAFTEEVKALWSLRLILHLK